MVETEHLHSSHPLLTAARISGSRRAVRGAASRRPASLISAPYAAPTGSSSHVQARRSPRRAARSSGRSPGRTAGRPRSCRRRSRSRRARPARGRRSCSALLRDRVREAGRGHRARSPASRRAARRTGRAPRAGPASRRAAPAVRTVTRVVYGRVITSNARARARSSTYASRVDEIVMRDHPERRGVLPELVVHLDAEHPRREAGEVDRAGALQGVEQRHDQADRQRRHPRRLRLRVPPHIAQAALHDRARAARGQQPAAVRWRDSVARSARRPRQCRAVRGRHQPGQAAAARAQQQPPARLRTGRVGRPRPRTTPRSPSPPRRSPTPAAPSAARPPPGPAAARPPA